MEIKLFRTSLLYLFILYLFKSQEITNLFGKLMSGTWQCIGCAILTVYVYQLKTQIPFFRIIVNFLYFKIDDFEYFSLVTF